MNNILNAWMATLLQHWLSLQTPLNGGPLIHVSETIRIVSNRISQTQVLPSGPLLCAKYVTVLVTLPRTISNCSLHPLPITLLFRLHQKPNGFLTPLPLTISRLTWLISPFTLSMMARMRWFLVMVQVRMLLILVPLLSPLLICDNVGATQLSLNPIFHSRMKHIAIDLHFVCNFVYRGQLRVAHVHTDDLVDLLTKPLARSRFTLLHDKIHVADGTSILRGLIRKIPWIQLISDLLLCLASLFYYVS